MNESVLKDFFEGTKSPEELRANLKDAKTTRDQVNTFHIVEMDSPFTVKTYHLIKVCDAVLEGKLPPSDLEKIGFCIVTSDQFEFESNSKDGSRVAETVHNWADYVVNYVLSVETTRKFRNYLASGQNDLSGSDLYENRQKRNYRSS